VRAIRAHAKLIDTELGDAFRVHGECLARVRLAKVALRVRGFTLVLATGDEKVVRDNACATFGLSDPPLCNLRQRKYTARHKQGRYACAFAETVQQKKASLGRIQSGVLTLNGVAQHRVEGNTRGERSKRVVCVVENAVDSFRVSHPSVPLKACP
jgi:hypothetical protein